MELLQLPGKTSDATSELNFNEIQKSSPQFMEHVFAPNLKHEFWQEITHKQLLRLCECDNELQSDTAM